MAIMTSYTNTPLRLTEATINGWLQMLLQHFSQNYTSKDEIEDIAIIAITKLEA